MENSPSDQAVAPEGELSTPTFTPESPRQSFKTLEQYKSADFSAEEPETEKEESRREESIEESENWAPTQSNPDSEEEPETEKEQPRREESFEETEDWAQSQSHSDSEEEVETEREEYQQEESVDEAESWDPEQSDPDSDEEKFEEQGESPHWTPRPSYIRKNVRQYPFPKPIKPMPPRYLRKDTPAPVSSENWVKPWAQMRTYCFNPCVFPAMVGAVSSDAQAGNWVKVYDREGSPFGAAFYNPKAKVPLRVLVHGDVEPGDQIIFDALERALTLRQEMLKLPERTNAYRVVNSDGDGLSGLIVDRYDNVLSLEVHSLGIYLRLNKILEFLHQRLGTQYEIIHVDERVRQIEGIKNVPEPRLPGRSVKIQENGVKFEVDFSKGHKTGFFCDQRENRLKFSGLVHGKRVLDLCCYTGAFSIMASVLGGAAEVTGVDLDEEAIEQAKRNAHINMQHKINWVHADAYSYARQMQTNGEKWDVILIDPPKFVESRDPEEEFKAWGKYEDINKLGISLLAPGGTLVSCSCSGLLSLNRFEDILVKAAHRNNRRLQIFDVTGAGSDHPIYSNCPESRYLKVLWTRVI